MHAHTLHYKNEVGCGTDGADDILEFVWPHNLARTAKTAGTGAVEHEEGVRL